MMELLQVYSSTDEEDEEKDSTIISSCTSTSSKGTKRTFVDHTGSNTTIHHKTQNNHNITSKDDARNNLIESSVDNASSVLFERTVPHIPGNWAGHVYAQPDPQRSENLRSAFQKVGNEIKSRLLSLQQQDITILVHANTPESLHISLSKLFFLQHPSLPLFERLLRQRLEVERTATVSFQPYQLEVLMNDSQTRTFVTCPAVAGSVKHLTQATDDVLTKFHQPCYYANPNIHISILSVKGNQKHLLQKCIEECCFISEDLEFTIFLNSVYCTLGTVKKITIPLNTNIS